MTDDEKREHAEAIKAALGMSYGPPMEGEEGWCFAMTDEEHIKRWNDAMREAAKNHKPSEKLDGRGWLMVEDADDEDFDATAQAIMDELREKKERRMAEELAKRRAKAAEPKPSTDPWAVIGKAEDDGEAIMRETRRFC